MTYQFLTPIIALGALLTFDLSAKGRDELSWSDKFSASSPSTTYETQNDYMTYTEFKPGATLLKISQNLDASKLGSVPSGSYAWFALNERPTLTTDEVSRINQNLPEGTSLHSKGNGLCAVEFDLSLQKKLEDRVREASDVIKSEGGPRALQGRDLKDTTVSALTVAIRKKAG